MKITVTGVFLSERFKKHRVIFHILIPALFYYAGRGDVFDKTVGEATVKARKKIPGDCFHRLRRIALAPILASEDKAEPDAGFPLKRERIDPVFSDMNIADERVARKHRDAGLIHCYFLKETGKLFVALHGKKPRGARHLRRRDDTP